ncbi:MAG: hypothetical protein HYV75_10650 [Opitutae bacterium]|nr:hypothetical protein [Opitutae bacterium]
MPSLRQVVDGTYSPLALELVEMLIAAAVRRRHRPPGRGLTLRPGPDTPLWRDELVRQVRPHLRKYGAKAQLARLLGLPRQRLQDCLKAGSASLDAERTLLLLGWLGFFQRGGELTPVVRPGRRSRQPGAPPVPGNV